MLPASKPTNATPARRHRSRPLLGLAITLTALLAAFVPAAANAAFVTIGSPLSVPTTLNTAENLGYPGTYTPVPPAPDAPNGLYHTYHYGADTALWNVGQASGLSRTPATGQAVKVKLEGCAQEAAGGPAPLTEIHFQDLTPLSGGGAKVNITSQGFNIPVCGQGGASGSTVSTYDPINLCVSAGDYVGFNDDGGYVPNVYRAGVPYQVLGSVQGSTADSFLRNSGTGNGAVMSSSDLSANDGFAVNHSEELMMQVQIGTGSDATHICAGGTAGLPPVLPPIRVSPQTDGVNHERIVAVAVYCRLKPECRGVATLTLSNLSGYAGSTGSSRRTVGRAGFSLPPNKTTHLPIRLAASVMGLIRTQHGITARLTAVVAGKTITQTIKVKIL
jgi:hypothetical protein